MSDPSEGRDPSTGRFLPQNRFWEARVNLGAKPLHDGPESLWAACIQYFDWAADNPLYEDKLVTFQGFARREPVAKMRAMTLAGLCLFLEISEEAWRGWRTQGHELHRPDLLGVISRAEAVIYQQKFEGAAADLLNANIIARDLGLADRSEVMGKDGAPVQTQEVSARDILAGKLALLASRFGEAGASGEPD